LSIAKAVAIAKQEAAPAKASDFMVIGIELKYVRVADVPRWYYFINGYRLSEVYAETPPQLVNVLILMSGDVVQPTEEPAHEWPPG
jgi:hypothetical protein